MQIALAEKAACQVVFPKKTNWPLLCGTLSKLMPGEKDGFAWMPVFIEQGPRANARVKSISAIVLDIENTKGIKPPSLKTLEARLIELNWSAHVHTSYNHTSDNPRYRVIIKLAHPMAKELLKPVLKEVAIKLDLEDCRDEQCSDPARLYYLPRCPKGNEKIFCAFTFKGNELSPETLLANKPTELHEAPYHDPVAATILQFPKPETPENIAEVKAMLDCLDAGCSRAEWMRRIFSVLSTHWNCAVQLTLEWSKGAPDKFDQKEFDNVVNSYNPDGGITLGTLYHHARSAGWKETVPMVQNPEPDQLHAFLTVDQLNQLPPTKWRVKGLLPDRGLASVYGPTSSGKSFLVIDMIAKIATGENFFGYKTKQCPVVYVALEGAGGIAKRIQAYESQHKTKLPDTFRVVTDHLSLFNSDAETFASEINAAGLHAGIIVIDTLAQSAPEAEENTSSDMGRILSNAQLLARITGSLVVLVHHTGKDVSRGARGHSSLAAALDAAIEVKRPLTGREWRIAKSKDGEDGVTHPFRLQIVDLGLDEDSEPITSCAVVSDLFRQSQPKEPKGRNQKAVLDALNLKYSIGDLVFAADVLALAQASLPNPTKNARQRAKEAIKGLVELERLTPEGDEYKLI
jgi:hypothetical protein